MVLFLISVSRNKIHTGCSRSTKKYSLGCQPIDKPCNPVVLLQLSTNNRARQCYCDADACNKPSDLFKVVLGGYLLLIIGIMGIIGNLLGLGVLCATKKKNDIDYILTGTYLKRLIHITIWYCFAQ